MFDSVHTSILLRVLAWTNVNRKLQYVIKSLYEWSVNQLFRIDEIGLFFIIELDEGVPTSSFLFIIYWDPLDEDENLDVYGHSGNELQSNISDLAINKFFIVAINNMKTQILQCR